MIRRYFTAANHVTFRRTRHDAASKTSAVDDHVNIIHANMTQEEEHELFYGLTPLENETRSGQTYFTPSSSFIQASEQL